MKNKPSPTPSKEQTTAWRNELAWLEQQMAVAESAGQSETYWHTRARQVRQALDEYEGE